MKAGTKRAAAALPLILSSALLFAFDFGFELSNSVGGKYVSDLDWFTDHKGTVWINVPFDSAGHSSLAVEGGFYASRPLGSDEYTWFADLDLFRLKLNPGSSGGARVSFDIGRLPESDVTGFVLGQNVDGVEIHGIFPFGNIDVFAGYTGLLNTRKGGALMTSDDQSDMADNADQPYGIGSKRAVGKVTLQVSQVFGALDVLLEGIGEYDLRPLMESDYSEAASLGYGTLSLTAPLGSSAFATLSGTWQSGLKESGGSEGSSNSLLASARFDAYPSAKNQFWGQFIYTPLRSDFFDVFTPVSYQSLGTLYARNFENLMRASAGWNFNPLKTFNLDFGGKVFMTAQTTDTQPDLYEGSEVSAGATLRAASDLKFRLDSYCWIPADGDMEIQAALKAILNF